MFIAKFFRRNAGIYPRFKIRIVCASFTGIFLVFFGEDDLLDMLHNYGFYLSCIGSIIIAILMSEFITQVSYHFDLRYPWRMAIKKRLLIQGILVFLSICLAVMLATFYFMVRDTSILVANYFKYDFTVVIFLVALVHAYYLILNLLKLKNSPLRRNLANNKPAPIPITGPEAPAVIFSDGKSNFVLKFGGEKVQWDKTLELTINELPNEHYFLISRSEIVHRAAISHYENHSSNILQLKLCLEFKERALMVAQRRSKDFKEWFERVGDLKGRPDEGD
jgi:hypothetical protein